MFNSVEGHWLMEDEFEYNIINGDVVVNVVIYSGCQGDDCEIDDYDDPICKTCEANKIIDIMIYQVSGCNVTLSEFQTDLQSVLLDCMSKGSLWNKSVIDCSFID